MASLMSLFAHASGTESSASDSDIGDYYYVQFNVSVACEEKCTYSCEEKCTYCMYVSVNSTLMKDSSDGPCPFSAPMYLTASAATAASSSVLSRRLPG